MNESVKAELKYIGMLFMQPQVIAVLLALALLLALVGVFA